MASNRAIVDSFLDACWENEMPKVQVAITSGQLTVEDLGKGLDLATEKSCPEIVAALFEAGASVSTSTIDALSISHQHPSIIRIFLDHDLDSNARDSDGEPLLGCFLDPACPREFLLRGADPNLRGPSGRFSLYRHLQGSREENTPLAELFLEHGARLEPDLLFAAVSPRMDHQERITTFLLAKGLDPNISNAEWGTPLHVAVYAAKPNVVKILLDTGADPTTQVAGRRFPDESPMQMAQSIVANRPSELMQSIVNILQQRL